MNIKKIMLRYYVPFSFKCNKIDDYKSVCDLCQTSVGSQMNALTSEDDFFDNISALYKPDNLSSVGSFFALSKVPMPKLVSKDKTLSVDISQAGLFINKNGIGILWYEVSPCSKIIQDTEMLLNFQNSFKELARSKTKFSWMKHISEKVQINHIHDKNEVLTDRSKISKFVSQNHLSHNMDDIEKVVLKKGEKTLLIKSKDTDFQLGLWIRDLLEFIDGLHFMPERIKKENQKNIPDKAILCSCVAYETAEQEKTMDFIFWLTHGYTKNYQRKNNFENDLYSPFKNIDWYATREGIGQYIQLTDSKNDVFFYDLAFNKMTNYCYLLTLVLQQYYSLLNYSKLISALPDDEIFVSKKAYAKMVSLTDNLNNFFLRNTFPQISHISHQNDVYEYLKDVYKINDSFEQVNNSLKSVLERTEMYRNEKHDDNIKMFAIIGAIFGASEVLCNTSDIISFILGKDSADQIWLITLLSVLLGSFLLGFSIWLLWYSSKYKKRK